MIRVAYSDEQGARQSVTFAKDEVSIGRGPDQDVVLNSGLVSKSHARLMVRDGKLMLEDRHSSNGTYLNGKKLVVPCPVGSTDEVTIGRFTLQAELVGAASSEAGPGRVDEATGRPGDQPRGSVPLGRAHIALRACPLDARVKRLEEDCDGRFLACDELGTVTRIGFDGKPAGSWRVGFVPVCATARGSTLFAAKADLNAHVTTLYQIELGEERPALLKAFESSIGIADLCARGDGEVVAVVWKWSALVPKGKGIIMIEWTEHAPYYKWGSRMVALAPRDGAIRRSVETNPSNMIRDGRLKDGRYVLFPRQGLAVCIDRNSAAIFELATFKPLQAFSISWAPDEGLERVTLSPDGSLLLVLAHGSRGHDTVGCYDLSTGAELWRATQPTVRHDIVRCNSQLFSPDGAKIFLAWDAEIVRLDARSGCREQHASLGAKPLALLGGALVAKVSGVSRIAFLDGATLREYRSLDVNGNRGSMRSTRAGAVAWQDEPLALLVVQESALPAPLQLFATIKERPRVLGRGTYREDHGTYSNLVETWSVVGGHYLFSFDKNGALLEKRVLQSYAVRGMIGRGVMLANNNVYDWDGEPLTADPLVPLWRFIEHSVEAEELSIVAGAGDRESMALLVQADYTALVVLKVTELVCRESIPAVAHGYQIFELGVFELGAPGRAVWFTAYDPMDFVVARGDGVLARYTIHAPWKEGNDRSVGDPGYDGVAQPVSVERTAQSGPLAACHLLTGLGNRVVAASGRRLFAFELDGRRAWQCEADAEVVALLLVERRTRDLVVVATKGGLQVYDRGGGAIVWSLECPGIVALATADDADFVMLAHEDGQLSRLRLADLPLRSGAKPIGRSFAVSWQQAPAVLDSIACTGKARQP